MQPEEPVRKAVKRYCQGASVGTSAQLCLGDASCCGIYFSRRQGLENRGCASPNRGSDLRITCFCRMGTRLDNAYSVHLLDYYV